MGLCVSIKQRMKGGKDEERRLDPLFPRLHISDAEKSGPRTPPRNKMALCQQPPRNSPLKITAGSLMPPLVPSNTTSSSAPTASSDHATQVIRHEKTVFSPFYNAPGPSHPDNNLHQGHLPCDMMSSNTALAFPELQGLKPLNYKTVTAKVLPLAAEVDLFQHCRISSSMNICADKVTSEDRYRVPSCPQLGPSLSPYCWQNMAKPASSSSNSPRNLTSSSLKQLRETRETPTFDKEHQSSLAVPDIKVSQDAEYCTLSPVPAPTSRICSEHVVISSIVKDATSEQGIRPQAFMGPKKRFSLLDDLNRLRDSCGRSRQEFTIFRDGNKSTRNGVIEKPETRTRKRKAESLEGLSSFNPLADNDHGSPTRMESVNECPKDRNDGSFNQTDLDRNGGISDASVDGSLSMINESPDDSLGILGQKQFWKARKTMIHQQRIFALQVFELHRLIKVQRLIAQSPEILSETNLCTESSVNCLPEGKQISDNIIETTHSTVEPRVDSEKVDPILGRTTTDVCRKRPQFDSVTSKGFQAKQTARIPLSGTVNFTPIPDNVKLSPWSFHAPPGNQWLIPVRSPSEGLIYKPYTGSYPPPAGFMAPVYANCGPLSLSAVGGNFMNTASGIPASQRSKVGTLSGTAALSQCLIQSHSMSVLGSYNKSAVVQIDPSARVRSSEHDTHPPMRDICRRWNQSSHNVCDQKSGTVHDYPRNFQADTDHNFQGSNVTNPSNKLQGDALSLFPTTPTVQVSAQPVTNQNTKQQFELIKVVPHNPKLASESAARIFRSIQEERNQQD